MRAWVGMASGQCYIDSLTQPLLPGWDANLRADVNALDSFLVNASGGHSAEGAGHVRIHVTPESPEERFVVVQQGELPDHALADFSLVRNGRVVAGYSYNKTSTASFDERSAGSPAALPSVDVGYVRVVSMNSFSEDLCCALLGACLFSVEMYSNLVFLAAAAFAGQVVAACGLAAVFSVTAIAQLVAANHQARREWEADAGDAPSRGVGAGLFICGSTQWRWLTFACRTLFVLLGVPRRLKTFPTDMSPSGAIGVGGTAAFLRAANGAGAYLIKHSGEAEFRVSEALGFERMLPIQLGAVMIATLTKYWLMPDLGFFLLLLTIVPGVISVLRHILSLHDLCRNRKEFYKCLLGRCVSRDPKERKYAVQMLWLHFGQEVAGGVDCNIDDPVDGSAVVEDGDPVATSDTMRRVQEILCELRELRDRTDDPLAGIAGELLRACSSVARAQEPHIGVVSRPAQLLCNSHALTNDPRRGANAPIDAEIETFGRRVAPLEVLSEGTQCEDMPLVEAEGDREAEELGINAGAEAEELETTRCSTSLIEAKVEVGEMESEVCSTSFMTACDHWLELFQADEERPATLESEPGQEPGPTANTVTEFSVQSESTSIVEDWQASKLEVESDCTVAPPEHTPMLVADQHKHGVAPLASHLKRLPSQQGRKARPLPQSREPSPEAGGLQSLVPLVLPQPEARDADDSGTQLPKASSIADFLQRTRMLPPSPKPSVVNGASGRRSWAPGIFKNADSALSAARETSPTPKFGVGYSSSTSNTVRAPAPATPVRQISAPPLPAPPLSVATSAMASTTLLGSGHNIAARTVRSVSGTLARSPVHRSDELTIGRDQVYCTPRRVIRQNSDPPINTEAVMISVATTATADRLGGSGVARTFISGSPLN